MSAQHHTVGLGRAVRGRETRQVSDHVFLASVNKETPRVFPGQSAIGNSFTGIPEKGVAGLFPLLHPPGLRHSVRGMYGQENATTLSHRFAPVPQPG